MRWDQERAANSVEFDVQIVEDGARPTVILRGEVDLATVDQFSAALGTAVTACDGSGIELDLRETTFMGSAGLTALLTTHRRLGQVPEAIVLLDPSPSLRRLFELAGVDDLFTVRETQKWITANDGAAPSASSSG